MHDVEAGRVAEQQNSSNLNEARAFRMHRERSARLNKTFARGGRMGESATSYVTSSAESRSVEGASDRASRQAQRRSRSSNRH